MHDPSFPGGGLRTAPSRAEERDAVAVLAVLGITVTASPTSDARSLERSVTWRYCSDDWRLGIANRGYVAAYRPLEVGEAEEWAVEVDALLTLTLRATVRTSEARGGRQLGLDRAYYRGDLQRFRIAATGRSQDVLELSINPPDGPEPYLHLAVRVVGAVLAPEAGS